MSIIDLTLATLMADNMKIQLTLERVINGDHTIENKVEWIKECLEQLVINEMSVTKLQTLISNNENIKKTENG